MNDMSTILFRPGKILRFWYN